MSPRSRHPLLRLPHVIDSRCLEVRQEAVQQALAAMQGRPKPSLPMPSKRTSVMARSPDRERCDSGESSSDEDSVVTEESPGAGGPTGIVFVFAPGSYTVKN